MLRITAWTFHLDPPINPEPSPAALCLVASSMPVVKDVSKLPLFRHYGIIFMPPKDARARNDLLARRAPRNQGANFAPHHVVGRARCPTARQSRADRRVDRWIGDRERRHLWFRD